MNYSKLIAVGRVTRDPEMRVTPQGTAICSFSIAINRTWNDQGGQKREEVTFLDCECWQKLAETVSKYVRQGSEILVDGRLKQDAWEDKQTGAKRSKIKVVVEDVRFGAKSKDDGADGGQTTTQPARAADVAQGDRSPQPRPASTVNEPDGDVPF